MARGAYIIGTDTEVGKTVIAAGLMTLLLKRDYQAAYFKPVASGGIEDETGFHSADAYFVREISGFEEEESLITPFAFREATAPHLAARWEGKPISSATIRDACNIVKCRYDVVLAEAAGGLAVPLTDDGYMQYDLIKELGFPCILVARAGLGTINHTLLTLHLARAEGLPVTALFINQYTDTPLERENVEVLRRLSGIEALYKIPHVSTSNRSQLLPVFDTLLNLPALEALFKPLP